MKIYSIKDKATGFTSTFTASNDYEAMRIFVDTAKDERTMLHNHPEDFELYRLGELNKDNGEIKAEVKFLQHAIEIVQK